MFDIRTARWGRVIAVPFAAVALVGLAACGTDTEASAASAGGTADGAAAQGRPSDAEMEAYTSCLAQNGVTLPERPAGGDGGPPDGRAGGTPPSGAPAAPEAGDTRGGRGGPGSGQAPPGVDADTWAAAQQACADVAPAAPGGAAPTS